MAASPAPPTTVRRNPPRRARPPPTPLRSAKPKPTVSTLLDEAAAAPAAADAPSISPPPPTPTPASAAALSSSSSSQDERLKVYLRIRPLPGPERQRCKPSSRLPNPNPKAKEQVRKPSKQQDGAGAGAGVCLVATGANSVALTVPQSKFVDLKRGRTEVFDGFSAVLPPESSQHDIFTQVMNPLVDEFLGGKSVLLVAMGPTGSGKTHTVFGTPRNPGIVPLTLQKIFNITDESDGGNQPTRFFSLSMFEILCEGKGERILDLLSDAADLVLQQSTSTTIKGLKEVAISNSMDAESLVSHGMLKRSTAATNANSESSRSQCIITIRAIPKNNDLQSEHQISGSVLTIADLAGAERKKCTGNKGSRLLESNFINNTSMVFGLCLRALLDHQKKQKKTLEKHFKNSLLTRYLRDYLEGRKRMTLILNVKPGDGDYSDTSFLLRQASPYMKIRYTSLDDSSDLVTQKRSNASLICQENRKKRKVHKPEVLTAKGKDTIDKPDDIEVSERDAFLNLELQRVSRSEQIMKNLFRTLWAVSKQKLLESESAAKRMRELLIDKDIQIIELKKELNDLKSRSHEKFPIAADTPVERSDAVTVSQAALSSVSQSDQTERGSSDAALDAVHIVAQVVDKESGSSGSCSEQIPAHDAGVAHATSHLDHPSDRSFAELHILPCMKSEQASLSQFSVCGKKAPVEQSEEALSNNIKVEDIQHNADIEAMKHHDCPSFSQQAISAVVDVSSNQPFLELQGMGAVQQNPEEPVCESHLNDHGDSGDMLPQVLNERESQMEASVVLSKDDREAEGVRDKKEDLCASRPCKTKKTTRRLRPVAGMMLKEFSGTELDAAADTKKQGGGGEAGAGRSDKLIRLLKSRPESIMNRRS